MTETQHIYISPHIDDAVLSCGGRIAMQRAAGAHVTVATLFAGVPDPDRLSPFARQIHDRAGAGIEPMAALRLESQAAVAVLDAEGRLGDELDAIYRQDRTGTRWLYDSEEAIFGPIHQDEADEPGWLAASLAALAPAAEACILYAPLAIGGHVDHRLLRRAGEILQGEGYQVRFYEDYPYVARDPSALASALAHRRRNAWRATFAALDQAALARKIEAVQCYTSQLHALFGDPDAAPAALEAFARQVATEAGRDGLAERYWHLDEGAGGTAKARKQPTSGDGPSTATRRPKPHAAAAPLPSEPSPVPTRRVADAPATEAPAPSPAPGLWQRIKRFVTSLFQ